MKPFSESIRVTKVTPLNSIEKHSVHLNALKLWLFVFGRFFVLSVV